LAVQLVDALVIREKHADLAGLGHILGLQNGPNRLPYPAAQEKRAALPVFTPQAHF
jgi:hypothetical protein